jgi:hypothetical protein
MARRFVVLEPDSCGKTLALPALLLSVFWRPDTLQVVTMVSEELAARVFKNRMEIAS